MSIHQKKTDSSCSSVITQGPYSTDLHYKTFCDNIHQKKTDSSCSSVITQGPYSTDLHYKTASCLVSLSSAYMGCNKPQTPWAWVLVLLTCCTFLYITLSALVRAWATPTSESASDQSVSPLRGTVFSPQD